MSRLSLPEEATTLCLEPVSYSTSRILCADIIESDDSADADMVLSGCQFYGTAVHSKISGRSEAGD